MWVLFNDKSCALAVGPRSRSSLPQVTLGNVALQWCSSVKYLGIVFCSGVKLSCDIDVISRKFYGACNSILSNTSGSPEIVRLHLQCSYSLPILQYGTAAVKLSQSQISYLNACWNSVYRKIFGFNKWNSVKQFIAGLGYLDFMHLRILAMLNLYKSMLESSNSVVRHLYLTYSWSDECSDLYVSLNINVNWSRARLKRSIYDRFLTSADL